MSKLADGIAEFVAAQLAQGEVLELRSSLREFAEETLTSWVEDRTRTQHSQVAGRDRVAVVGHVIDLSIRLASSIQTGIEVTFLVNGERVGIATTNDLGVAVCSYVPSLPGVHLVTTTHHDGVDLFGNPEQHVGRLQVVGDRPVIAVDARLLDIPQPTTLVSLRTLVQRGIQLCWASLDEADQTDRRAEQLAAAGLPAAAILSIPTQDVGFDTMGVDFSQVAIQLAVRRLRAMGVPLVAVITDVSVDERSHVAGLTIVSSSALLERLTAGSGLSSFFAAARQFVTERDRAHQAGTMAVMSRRLDMMTQTQPSAGNDVDISMDNRQSRLGLFADIERAKSSIHLQFYILTPGRFATALTGLLRSKASEGVAVRVVVDALYSGHEVLGKVNPVLAELDKTNTLQQADGEPSTETPVDTKIEIVASDPISLASVDLVLLKQRDHRKLVVIDDEIAYVTGRNGADEYYVGYDEVPIDDATPHADIPWFDAHARIRGPLVTELQRIFLDNWHRNGGSAVAPATSLQRIARPTTSSIGTHPDTLSERQVTGRIVFHDGIGDADALASYEALFNSARERLIIVNDFPIIADLSAALVGAIQRGVRVDILTGCALARRGDGTFFEGGLHRELFEYMVKRCYEHLLKVGVGVYEYAAPELENITATGGAIRPYVHAKLVVADSCVVSIGTANLDVTASHWEREVSLVLESAKLGAKLTTQLDAIFARSYAIDPESEYWRHESSRRAIASRLWPERFYS